ncbi:hypothetical protein [Microbacterium sp.]|uniref:hypothetical protein n=1 Tax=Microbacterium sp. TaxID=51671 RepID=UPI00333EAA0E
MTNTTSLSSATARLSTSRRTTWALLLAGTAVLALLPVLAACSAVPAPDKPSTPVPSASESADSGTGGPEGAGSDVKGACTAFNDLATRLREADESEKGVFVSIYEDARKGAEEAPEDIRDALTALGIVALDRDGGSVPQEDRDLMVEQLTRITPICDTVDVEVVL